MDKEIKINYEELSNLCKQLLIKQGLKKEHAQLTTEAICTASLRGTDSHGIRLLPHYVDAIEAGRINANAEFDFEQTTSSTGILDAKHGIAHAAVATAMDQAIKLAEKSGTGFVSIKNSNHCGAMAFYGLRAAKKDMIGLAFTNATAKQKVFNSKKPFFGINPICVTAPMKDEEPFCYDSAPTVMSNNKIKIHKAKGEKLPDEVAADKDGEMTNDPSFSAMLLPLGGSLAGYKGFGMAMVGDIFCSLLSGMPNGKDVSTMYPEDGGNLEDKRYLGQFVGAINLDAFEDVDRFKQRLRETAEKVRDLPKSDTEDVMIPGDPEKKAKKERRRKGIPIDRDLYNKLTSLK